MGMSLVLYAIRDSDSIQTESDLEAQLEASLASSVNLYKVFTDVSMVFNNTAEPFSSADSFGFKAVMGISGEGEFQISGMPVVGFLTNKQATEIHDWLKSLNIDTESHFLEFYEKLDEEVKETLNDYGLEPQELFSGYISPLLELYDRVVKEKKAIIFCLE